jgi:hypothetical protein
VTVGSSSGTLLDTDVLHLPVVTFGNELSQSTPPDHLRYAQASCEMQGQSRRRLIEAD